VRILPFIEVIWEDAMSTPFWVDRNDLPKAPKHVTRGWLIHEDDKKIILAGTLQLTEGDALGEVALILKGMIVSKRVMRIKEPKVK